MYVLLDSERDESMFLVLSLGRVVINYGKFYQFTECRMVNGTYVHNVVFYHASQAISAHPMDYEVHML